MLYTIKIYTLTALPCEWNNDQFLHTPCLLVIPSTPPLTRNTVHNLSINSQRQGSCSTDDAVRWVSEAVSDCKEIQPIDINIKHSHFIIYDYLCLVVEQNSMSVFVNAHISSVVQTRTAKQSVQPPYTKYPTDRLGQASMIRTHLSSTSPTVPLSSVTPSAVSTSYTNSKRKWFLLYMHTLLKWCNMYFFSFYATVLYTQDNHPHLQFLSHLHVLQTQQI